MIKVIKKLKKFFSLVLIVSMIISTPSFSMLLEDSNLFEQTEEALELNEDVDSYLKRFNDLSEESIEEAKEEFEESQEESKEESQEELNNEANKEFDENLEEDLEEETEETNETSYEYAEEPEEDIVSEDETIDIIEESETSTIENEEEVIISEEETTYNTEESETSIINEEESNSDNIEETDINESTEDTSTNEVVLVSTLSEINDIENVLYLEIDISTNSQIENQILSAPAAGVKAQIRMLTSDVLSHAPATADLKKVKMIFTDQYNPNPLYDTTNYVYEEYVQGTTAGSFTYFVNSINDPRQNDFETYTPNLKDKKTGTIFESGKINYKDIYYFGGWQLVDVDNNVLDNTLYTLSEMKTLLNNWYNSNPTDDIYFLGKVKYNHILEFTFPYLAYNSDSYPYLIDKSLGFYIIAEKNKDEQIAKYMQKINDIELYCGINTPIGYIAVTDRQVDLTKSVIVRTDKTTFRFPAITNFTNFRTSLCDIDTLENWFQDPEYNPKLVYNGPLDSTENFPVVTCYFESPLPYTTTSGAGKSIYNDLITRSQSTSIYIEFYTEEEKGTIVSDKRDLPRPVTWIQNYGSSDYMNWTENHDMYERYYMFDMPSQMNPNITQKLGYKFLNLWQKVEATDYGEPIKNADGSFIKIGTPVSLDDAVQSFLTPDYGLFDILEYENLYYDWSQSQNKSIGWRYTYKDSIKQYVRDHHPMITDADVEGDRCLVYVALYEPTFNIQSDMAGYTLNDSTTTLVTFEIGDTFTEPTVVRGPGANKPLKHWVNAKDSTDIVPFNQLQAKFDEWNAKGTSADGVVYKLVVSEHPTFTFDVSSKNNSKLTTSDKTIYEDTEKDTIAIPVITNVAGSGKKFKEWVDENNNTVDINAMVNHWQLDPTTYVTYYAVAEDALKVEFDVLEVVGGKGTVSGALEFYENDPYTIPTITPYSDYSFKGWTKDLSTKVIETDVDATIRNWENSTPTSNLKLYAVMEGKPSVTFEVDHTKANVPAGLRTSYPYDYSDGTSTATEDLLMAASDNIENAITINNGYKFVGWTYNGNPLTKAELKKWVDDPQRTDIVVEAQIEELKSFELNLDTSKVYIDGDPTKNKISLKENETYDSTITYKDVSGSGKKFLGFGTGGNLVIPKNEVEAKFNEWKANPTTNVSYGSIFRDQGKFKIELDSNYLTASGQTEFDEDVSKDVQDPITLPTIAGKNGHKFSGQYSLSPKGQALTSTELDNLINNWDGTNKTLYALYETDPDAKRATFEIDTSKGVSPTGAGTIEVFDISDFNTKKSELNTLTAKGNYQFDGWEYNGQVITDLSGVTWDGTSNITLKAKFSEKSSPTPTPPGPGPGGGGRGRGPGGGGRGPGGGGGGRGGGAGGGMGGGGFGDFGFYSSGAGYYNYMNLNPYLGYNYQIPYGDAEYTDINLTNTIYQTSEGMGFNTMKYANPVNSFQAQSVLENVPNIVNGMVNVESDTSTRKFAWLTNDNSTWYMLYIPTNTLVRNAWVYTGYNNSYGWYHFGHSGVMDRGWLNDSGYTYYLDNNGKMLVGQHYLNGNAYIFAPNGILIN